MDKTTFNFLQKVAYDYKDTLRLIDEIENDIIHSKQEKDDIQAGRTSVRNNTDITAIKATTLVENERLQMLRKQTQAVEYALKNLIDIKREFIELVYWQESRRSIISIAIDNNLSERTAYRWRREFLSLIGKKLGLI